jgi:hypothetical protein
MVNLSWSLFNPLHMLTSNHGKVTKWPFRELKECFQSGKYQMIKIDLIRKTTVSWLCFGNHFFEVNPDL